MKLGALSIMGALGCAALATPAVAADLGMPAAEDMSFLTNFYVHVGGVGVFMDERAKIKAAGTRLPGATISIDPQYTGGLEIGYFFTPNWAVSVAGGFPPVADIDGAGSIEGFGKLGSMLYGPMSLTAHYHFTGLGAFQPYIGAGPMVMFVLDNRDDAIHDVKVDSAVGAVVQVGADYMFNRNWGVHFDVKKAYLRTNAKGMLGPVPLTADVKLDPLAVSAGITYRF